MHLADVIAGSEFNVSDVSAFKQLTGTKFNKESNYIVCLADKLSVINTGTFIVPVMGDKDSIEKSTLLSS